MGLHPRQNPPSAKATSCATTDAVSENSAAADGVEEATRSEEVAVVDVSTGRAATKATTVTRRAERVLESFILFELDE